jgi:uncharacterized membrane protein (Fun14 family)
MPGSTISSVLDALMQGFACRKVISLVYMEIQADMLVIHDIDKRGTIAIKVLKTRS